MIENLDVAACPSQSQLEQLLADDLPAEQRAGVERHVENCLSCQSALARLTEDSLLDRAAPLKTSTSGGLLNLVGGDAIPASRASLSDNQGTTMITLSCSACQKQLKVKPALAGKKVKCPGCGQVILVPSTADVPSPANPDMATLPPDASKAPSREVQPLADTHPPAGKPDVTRALGQAAPEHDPSLTDFLAPAQADDELGRLGKYRVLKILGHGGMGVVYRAEDVQLKRSVALKAMLPGMAASASAGKRFLREAQSMAALEHDHIVRIYQVDEDRGVPFLAMEFLKGEPLDERLKRDERLPLPDVLRIGREIAEALSVAHTSGLIHRDIKPANIWLEAPRNRVKILDFGLARAVSENSGLTQTGAIIGTPAYMAPEQGRGDPADARTDLFALGVVLYRMVSGRQPFLGKDTVSTLLEVATVQPAAPSKLNAAIPKELSDLVMKLLEKDPARRPASASEVVDVLKGLERKYSREEDAHDKTESLPAAPKFKTSPSSRKKLPVLVGSLLLAVAAGIGLWAAGVIRFSSDQGDLVLETDDPNFAFTVGKGGSILLEDRKTKRSFVVKAVAQGNNQYELEITDTGADLTFKTKTFTVKRGDKVALKAWFERKGETQSAAVPTLDDQIEVAKWVLSKKGLVIIRKDDIDHRVSDAGKFPAAPFTIIGVDLTATAGQLAADKITNSDMARLVKLADLEQLSLNHQTVTEKGLAHLTGCKKLKSLTFGGSQIDAKAALPIVAQFKELEAYDIMHDVPDEYAELLARLPNVKKVLIWTTMPSAKGLARLAQAPKLESLSIGGHTTMTDDDLKILLAAKNLRELWLENPKQTLAGVQAFQKMRPQCRITFNRQPLPETVNAPPPANTPFDAKQARAHQEAWAKHLGVPVEKTNALGMKFMLIPPGDFTMGASKEDLADWPKLGADKTGGERAAPAHKVRLTQPIYMARREVRIADFVELMKRLPGNVPRPKDESPDVPVMQYCSWYDCVELCNRLSEREGRKPAYKVTGKSVRLIPGADGYRLPTEAEWEFACRAGTSTLWYYGMTAAEAAKDLKAAQEQQRSQLAKPNPFGLYNMYAGSSEWCWDWHDPEYYRECATQGVVVDPTGPETGQNRIKRGGTTFDVGGWEMSAVNSAVRHPHGTDWNDIRGQGVWTGFGRIVLPAGAKSSGASAVASLDDWHKEVAKLPPEKQVEAVVAKLKERNPKFDGKVLHQIKDGAVWNLNLDSARISDITPLRALPGLQRLSLYNTDVSDLTPLKGLELVYLNTGASPVTDLSPLRGMPLADLCIHDNKVTDLSPLAGMKLGVLICERTSVTDLSPLKEAPLKEIRCDFKPERDAAILRSIKTLEQINGKPAADFWKEVEAAAKPISDAWFKEIAALPAEKQAEAVVAKIIERNPGYDPKTNLPPFSHKVEGEVVTELRLSPGKYLKDLSPMRALPGLRALICEYAAELTDLSPLKGMKLTRLHLGHTKVADLTLLQGMPLTWLDFEFTPVKDLTPLKGMPLTELSCRHTQVQDLSPLKGMVLTRLRIDGCGKVTDLSPIKDMKLTSFCLAWLNDVSDISPLKDMPLKEITYVDPYRYAQVLRPIKTLEKINDKPAADIWKAVDTVAPNQPVDDAWIKAVGALPVTEQVGVVVAKLKVRNPKWADTVLDRVRPTISNGVVTELTLPVQQLFDISPLRALTGLESLSCSWPDLNVPCLADASPLKGMKLQSLALVSPGVTDLSPLKGMPLTRLEIRHSKVSDLSLLRGMPLTSLDCSLTKVADLSPLVGMKLTELSIEGTGVADLSPLKGMPLSRLDLRGTKVTDLSPLKEVPLKEIQCDFNAGRDAAILRSIKTLEKINGKPAADFWKQIDAIGPIPDAWFKEISALPAKVGKH